MLGAGVAIGAAVGLTRKDTVFLLVLIWAFAAIAAKHWGRSDVAFAALAAAAAVAVVAASGLIPRSNKPRAAGAQS